MVKVKADENGMDMGDFREQLKRNLGEVFFVNATVGTCVSDSVDSIHKIHQICKEESEEHIWIHADAAFGGTLLLAD